MKYFAALLAAAGAASAAAKSLSTYMPDCAVPCLTSAISAATTCKGPEDLECFCIDDNYRAIYDSAVACVLQTCGDDVAVLEVLPKAAKMCEEVVAASGQPVTSVGAPAPAASDTTSDGPDATADDESDGPDATSENESASTSTSTNAADARVGAHVFGLVVPLVLAAAANL